MLPALEDTEPRGRADTRPGDPAPCGRGRPVPPGGRTEVWAEQWLVHHGDLVRYTRRLLSGDLQAAEDVVQETALRLWLHPEVLDDGQPLSSWLRTVARNIVIDQSRRRRVRPIEVEWSAGAEPVGADPADQLVGRDVMTGILATLPPRPRTIVFEVYVRGRGATDVAGELAIPVGTVKSQCHHALRRLRASAADATGDGE